MKGIRVRTFHSQDKGRLERESGKNREKREEEELGEEES